MSTRKAPGNVDERPSKRPCVRAGDAAGLDTACFTNLPTVCKVHIFSFLLAEDMNSAAICSKDCCLVRAHESLDQKRTGTLVWRKDRTTEESFCKKLREVQGRFEGNRTCLRIEGSEKGNMEVAGPLASCEYRLSFEHGVDYGGVTTLDCSCPSGTGTGAVEGGSNSPTHALSWILPNLQELDLSNHQMHNIEDAFYGFIRWSTHLTKLTWNGGCANVVQCGYAFVSGTYSLTHLYLNDVVFNDQVVVGTMPTETKPASEHPESYLFMQCHGLEFLSIKGATVKSFEREDLPAQPLSQEDLIKMVRRHPTLRWLRSDLTAENVAMLKRARPAITFVSD